MSGSTPVARCSWSRQVGSFRRGADKIIPTRSVSEGRFRRSLAHASGYDRLYFLAARLSEDRLGWNPYHALSNQIFDDEMNSRL